MLWGTRCAPIVWLMLGCGAVANPPTGPTHRRNPLVAVGEAHACASTRHGIACWGRNDDRQVAPFDRRNLDGPSVAPITAIASWRAPNATQLALGSQHTCSLDEDGEVRCWGEHQRTRPSTPLHVVDVPGEVAQLVAQGSTTCARNSRLEVWCWGQVDHLADFDRAPGVSGYGFRNEPVELVALQGSSSVALNSTSICARRGENTDCFSRDATGVLQVAHFDEEDVCAFSVGDEQVFCARDQSSLSCGTSDTTMERRLSGVRSISCGGMRIDARR